ncbi:hypothetical protein HZ326_24039 [Fusarium oxysporum f. sp. albedinis]|nr:hypothetical protein HZ326_24039 [Fusarium oxysporum f. sp. albedinis]
MEGYNNAWEPTVGMRMSYSILKCLINGLHHSILPELPGSESHRLPLMPYSKALTTCHSFSETRQHPLHRIFNSPLAPSV